MENPSFYESETFFRVCFAIGVLGLSCLSFFIPGVIKNNTDFHTQQ